MYHATVARFRSALVTLNKFLVLLCHKRSLRQQGHLGRERTRWDAIRRRRMAIERGIMPLDSHRQSRGARSCLAHRVSEDGGPLPALAANVAEGKKTPLPYQEAVGCDGEGGM